MNKTNQPEAAPVESVVRWRCPKCRQPPRRFIELWNRSQSTIEFSLVGGVLKPDMHNPPDVEPTGVEAECECGHRWRLRGMVQITSLGIPVQR